MRAPRAQSILEFEEYVANDKENQDDAVTRAAIALLGDLAANLPATGPLLQGKTWVNDLLGQARTPCAPHIIARVQPVAGSLRPGSCTVGSVALWRSHTHIVARGAQARASGDSSLIEQASWANSTIMALSR